MAKLATNKKVNGGQIATQEQQAAGGQTPQTGAVPFGGPMPINKMVPPTPTQQAGAAAPPPAANPTGAQPPNTVTGGNAPPPAVPTPITPAPGGNGLPQFGPQNNLIASQIAPGGDPRLAGAQTLTDLAGLNVASFGGLSPFQGIGTGPQFDYAGDQKGARGLAGQGLMSLFSAPNRQSIALDRFQNLLDETGDIRDQGIRKIGQSAAKFGRIGSGKVTTDLGNLEDTLQTRLLREARGLSSDTAAQEMGDRLNRLGAAQSLSSVLSGQDLSKAGFQQGQRQEARGERGARTGFELSDLGARTQQLGALQGLENQAFGQGVSDRGELRGERGYQRGLAKDAQQSAIQQMMSQFGQQNTDFGQMMALNQMLGSLGFGGGGENFGPATALATLLGGNANSGIQGLNNLLYQGGAAG